MYTLNLPTYDVKLRKTEIGVEIFDSIRKRYVQITPEEWVRQHFVHYLVNEKKYPVSLIANEQTIQLNSLSRRCDTVIYNNKLEPLVICEYKNPSIEISQEVFDQIARYNIVLKVKYLIVSNGMSHYCCLMNYTNMSYKFIREIPFYKHL